MVRHVILGAGTAGKRAAEIIRKQDQQAEITLIEEEAEPFYYRPMLGRLLAGTGAVWVMKKDRDRFSRLGIRLVKKARVQSVDTRGQQVVCSDGSRVPYDKLLIATGRRTRRPTQDLQGAQGVVVLDSLEDAQRLALLLDAVRSAVVVGSSLQALEAMRGLRARGIDSTWLIPEERFWPAVLDQVASEIVEERLRQEGVNLLRQTDMQEILVERGTLRGVLTSRDDRVPADLVVIAAPQYAELGFLQGTDLEINKGVLVDESLRTRQENVFAAGDAARPPLAGARVSVPQPGWLNAWRQGNVAGMNMAGKTSRYEGVPSLRTQAFDLDIVCLGLSAAQGQGITEESGDYPYAELPYVYKKLVYRSRQVVGAIFLGDVSEAGKVEHWVRQAVPADQCDRRVLDQMFRPRLIESVAMGALCPVCKFQIQVGEGERAGQVVACPACGFEFRLEWMPNGVFRAVPLSD